MIACRENETDFYITVGDHFLASSGGFGEVTYRIDKKPAKTREFRESTSNNALGLWSGTGIPLLKEMIGGNSLLLRVTLFSESTVTLEYSISGLEEAIKPLRKACGW